MSHQAQLSGPSAAGQQFANEFNGTMLDKLRQRLPQHIQPQKFAAVVFTLVHQFPDLLQCDRQTVFTACLKCAQDGLLPDGREAAIIPYKNQASYQPMYQGWLKKVRNAGVIKRISCNVVYANDQFKYSLGDNEGIEHVPCTDFSNRGNPVAVYGIARDLDDQIFHREVLSWAEIMRARASSKMPDGFAWKNWPEEKGRVVCLKRICKYLPHSPEIQSLIDSDNEVEVGPATSANLNGSAQVATIRTATQSTAQAAVARQLDSTPLPAVTIPNQAATQQPVVSEVEIQKAAQHVAKEQVRTGQVVEALRQREAATRQPVPQAPVPQDEQYPDPQDDFVESNLPIEQPPVATTPVQHTPTQQQPTAPAKEKAKRATKPAAAHTTTVSTTQQVAQATVQAPVIPPQPQATVTQQQPNQAQSDGIHQENVLLHPGTKVRGSNQPGDPTHNCSALGCKENDHVMAFKFTDDHQTQYFTKDQDVATKIQLEYAKPAVRAIVSFVIDAKGYNWITNVEPVPLEG